MENRLQVRQLVMGRANDAKAGRVYKEMLNLHRATQRQRQLSGSDPSQRLALPSKRRQQVKQPRTDNLGIE